MVFPMKVQPGTDASCLHPDNDEHLWTGYVVIEKRSKREGCRDGAQADENLNQPAAVPDQPEAKPPVRRGMPLVMRWSSSSRSSASPTFRV